MKKSVIIFLLSVLVPSIVLGWMALSAAATQQIVIERRTAEVYQHHTDNIATAVRGLIDEQRRAFADAVRQILAEERTGDPRAEFTARLASTWRRKAIGFTLDAQGRLLSPSTQVASKDPFLQKFLWENAAFLCGASVATVYPVPVDDLNRPEPMRKKGAYAPEPIENVLVLKKMGPEAQRQQAQQALRGSSDPFHGAQVGNEGAQASETEQRRTLEENTRQVSPQQQVSYANKQTASQLWSETTEFRAISEAASEGMITRFVQDRLDMIFWLKPVQRPDTIFGCLINSEDLRDLWPAAMPQAEYRDSGEAAPEFILALLDDKARAVLTDPPGSTTSDWKRPFVASEIGEALPHWEAALYLKNPNDLRNSARAGTYVAYALVYAMVATIVASGWLLLRDTRRQLALAQKKTDFVSNVSHELKTPLTSIRMFAELMQSGRADATKQSQYSRIIMVEAERLTRLINNVLDFARLDRRQKRLEKRPLDLHGVIERTWQNHELHLQESGFRTRWQAAPGPYPVVGDEDALAQILVNLLSNAEKYSGSMKEVELHSYVDGGHACVSVLDRGPGVPEGEQKKIFEAFYRAHDSLANGVQGTGLGLTLAQRLAREHGGEITYQPRSSGGSNFTLRLPLQPETAEA